MSTSEQENFSPLYAITSFSPSKDASISSVPEDRSPVNGIDDKETNSIVDNKAKGMEDNTSKSGEDYTANSTDDDIANELPKATC